MSNITKSNGNGHGGDVQALIQRALNHARPKIMQCIPSHLNAERMFRVYMMACLSNPRLLGCTPLSLVGGVMQAAQFGLSLDVVTGEAWLIPRRSKMHQGKELAVFQIGYKGLRKLARQGDEDLQDVFGYPVHENDLFVYEYGEAPKITVHKPALGDEGKIRAAYAVAVWKSGYRRFVVVGPHDILRAQSSNFDAAQKPDSPWRQHPEAMWVKTATARLCRQLVLRSDVQVALQADGRSGESILREQAGTDASVRAMAIDVAGDDALADDEFDAPDDESSPVDHQLDVMAAKVGAAASLAPAPQKAVRGRSGVSPAPGSD